MSKRNKIITSIAVITIGLSLASAADARERGNNRHNGPNNEIIFGGNERVIYAPSRYDRRAINRPGRGYYIDDRRFNKRAKYKRKMRKMRRINRLNNYYRYERPVIIITRPIFR